MKQSPDLVVMDGPSAVFISVVTKNVNFRIKRLGFEAYLSLPP